MPQLTTSDWSSGWRLLRLLQDCWLPFLHLAIYKLQRIRYCSRSDHDQERLERIWAMNGNEAMSISKGQNRRILLPTTQVRRVLDDTLQKDGVCFQALEPPVRSPVPFKTRHTLTSTLKCRWYPVMNISRNAMLFAWLVALIWPHAEDRTDLDHALIWYCRVVQVWMSQTLEARLSKAAFTPKEARCCFHG